jgi:general secretion pathway protein G
VGAGERSQGPALSGGAPRRASRGFSLLELVVVIVLISILLAVAIERLLLTKARAEGTAMEQLVGTIRSAMTIRVAELVAGAHVPEVATLVGSNPILLLAEPPQNYLGQLFGPDPSILPSGGWYFDQRDRALCYLVESADYFQSALPAPPRACFAVVLVFDDMNGNKRYDPAEDTLRGLRLIELAPYEWRFEFIWPQWPGSRQSSLAQSRLTSARTKG